MERFNLRSFLLLLLAACFIASAFIPDFWIMVNYNPVSYTHLTLPTIRLV